MSRNVWLLFTAFLFFSATGAEAEELRLPPDQSFILSGDFNAAVQHVSFEDLDASATTIFLGPSFDYVVASGFTVGAQLAIAYSTSGDSSTTAVAAFGRLGYFAAISPIVGFWPRVALGYAHSSSSSGPSSVSAHSMDVSVTAPIVFAPVPHFFIGVGPTFMTLFATSDNTRRATVFGAQSVIGGWF